VITEVAPEFVQIAEAQNQYTPESKAIIERHVAPLLSAGADQIVLACTHFPLIADAIQVAVGSGVTLVDPSPAIARQTARLWPTEIAPATGPNQYFTTGDPVRFRSMLKTMTGVISPVQALFWSDDLHLQEMHPF
jgi:glutamate racemase